MSLVPLATPNFVSGPDDKLAVVDVYNQDTSVVINSISELSNSLLDEVLSNLSELTGLDIESIVNSFNQVKPTLTKDQIIARLFGDNNKLLSLFRQLDSKYSDYFNVNSKLKNQAIGSSNGVNFNLKNSDIVTIKKLSEMAEVFGDYQLTINDKSAQSGMISGLAKQSFELGIQGLLLKISEGKDDDVVLAVAAELLSGVVKNKNINALYEISLLPIAKQLLNIYPNLFIDFLTNFKLDTTIKEIEYLSLYNKLKDAFENIDPNWNKILRNNDEIFHLKLLTNGNVRDFFKLVDAKINNTRLVIPVLPSTNPRDVLPQLNIDEFYYKLVKSIGIQDVNKYINLHFSRLPVKVNVRVFSNR